MVDHAMYALVWFLSCDRESLLSGGGRRPAKHSTEVQAPASAGPAREAKRYGRSACPSLEAMATLLQNHRRPPHQGRRCIRIDPLLSPTPAALSQRKAPL